MPDLLFAQGSGSNYTFPPEVPDSPSHANLNRWFGNSDRMNRALDDRSIPPALNDPVNKDPEELPAPSGRPDPEFAGNYRSQGNLP